MSIETVTYILPEYVACYAMYGEPSGDDDLDSAYDSWLKSEISFSGFKSMNLVDVNDNGFMSYHELKYHGIGSCDTSEFVFHVTR